MRGARRLDGRAGRAGTGFLLVALAAALWGSDGLFRRGLALELPAAAVVFAEHVILVLLTLPFLLSALRSARRFQWQDWVSVTLIGCGASAVATILFTMAFRYGDPTTPLLLQKLQPVIAVAGAWIVLRERLMARYGLYFAAAVAGAYLVTFSDPSNVSVAQLAPALLAVGAAGLWGMGTVLGRRMTAVVEFRELAALRFAFGLPASAAILLASEGRMGFTVYGADDAAALLLLALIPGLMSLMIYYRGLSQTPAAAATLGELAFPLSAVTVNYLAFGTTLSSTQWLGMLLLTITITVMGLTGQRGAEGLGVRLGRTAPEGAPP